MGTSSSKLKVAVISYVVVDNTYSGQKKRIYDLVDGLSAKFDLTYIEISDCNESLLMKSLETQGVTYLKCNLNYSFFIKMFFAMLHRITFPFFGIKKSLFLGYWGAFSNRKAIRNWDYDIVISEYFMTSYFFKYIKDSTTKVIDMHDIQYVTLQEQLKKSSNHFFKKQIAFARQTEMKQLCRADALIAVNLDDILLLEKQLKTNYIFTPLTINESSFGHSKSLMNGDSINLAYFAGLSSERSYVEIKYILESIFPPLLEKFKDKIKLKIMGSMPSKKLIDLLNLYPYVELIGEISDIQVAFREVHFAIYHWMGSAYGFRTRVIDVLATGTPIFLNTACVAGMGLDNSSALFYCKESSQIIPIIVQYMDSQTAYNGLSQECFATAKAFSGAKVYNLLYNDLVKLHNSSH